MHHLHLIIEFKVSAITEKVKISSNSISTQYTNLVNFGSAIYMQEQLPLNYQVALAWGCQEKNSRNLSIQEIASSATYNQT